MFVVGERDVWGNKHVVFYDYTCWDEDEGPNLTVVAYLDAFLDVHVRVYLCVLAYLAAVEVYLVVDSCLVSYRCIVDDGVFCRLHFLTGISRFPFGPSMKSLCVTQSRCAVPSLPITVTSRLFSLSSQLTSM